ncbi:hypothetical protein IV67_GL000394 [Weissella minor]|uniref:Phosphatidic acid phosphatase type 2/haloperoxidase domain-containing protein n=2 Tax=Weissella minor TaxID=1620 RepID=A0A0R2JNC2_9LACO|nr:hypothetical protein IV67_GL000394 [Weissella minor]
MAGVVRHSPIINQIDQAIINGVQRLPFDNGFKVMTDFGSPELNTLLALGISIYVALKDKMLAIYLFSLYFVGAGLAYVMKALVQRPRPVVASVHFDGYSFPSGHAITTILLVMLVCIFAQQYLKAKTMQLLLIGFGSVWVFIIGASRVYLHAHFPTDVLASWCLAMAVWGGVTVLKQAYLNRT